MRARVYLLMLHMSTMVKCQVYEVLLVLNI